MDENMTFHLQGVKYESRSYREATIQLFNAIAEDDIGILLRFVQLPEHGDQGERYLARTKTDLYPPSKRYLAEKAIEFRKGWFIPGNGKRVKSVLDP
jgi:hypothetical protein